MNLFRSVRTPVLCAVPFLFASVLPLRAERTVRLFNRLELYSALSLRVPISSIRDESRSFTLYREPDGRRNGSPGWNCGSFEDAAGLCSLGSSDGIRLSFRDADFRLYGTLPPSAVAVLKTVRDAPALCRMLAAPRYGASVSFSHILPFALTVRAGSISPGGSWTRLSSPELYPSVSPFTGTYPLPEGLTASLPSSFSGGRLPAAAVCSEVPGSWKALKGSGISAFYRSDGMWAASGTCRAALPRMIRVCVSLTGGHFYLRHFPQLTDRARHRCRLDSGVLPSVTVPDSRILISADSQRVRAAGQQRPVHVQNGKHCKFQAFFSSRFRIRCRRNAHPLYRQFADRDDRADTFYAKVHTSLLFSKAAVADRGRIVHVSVLF